MENEESNTYDYPIFSQNIITYIYIYKRDKDPGWPSNETRAIQVNYY